MRSGNFVEETTTSIAGTSGNGAVTLTAITGKPRFSTVLGTQATTVRYVIEDTANNKFETGIGSVSSNVLTRTRPQITWDGSTYDDSTPSPIQFGSAPTSGDVLIRMSATAESQGIVINARNSSIAGDSVWRDYPITADVTWDNSGQNASLVAGTEYYSCYKLTSSGALTGIQFDVTSAVASSNMKLALYPVGSDGLPGAKIVDFNVVSTATTGIKTDTTTGTWSPANPVWLTPGWYYIGFINSHAVGIRGFGAYVADIKRTPLGRYGGYGWGNAVSASGNYASGLPASPAPTTMLDSVVDLSVPWIGLRVDQ